MKDKILQFILHFTYIVYLGLKINYLTDNLSIGDEHTTVFF